MELITEQTIKIGVPVAFAYRYTVDLEHFNEWFPGVLEMESVSSLPPSHPGKEYVETVAIPFRGRKQVRVRVRVAELDRLLVTEGDLPPVLPRMEIRFQPAGAESCCITWRMLSRNDSLLARIVILPIVKTLMRKRAASGLTRLKLILEVSQLSESNQWPAHAHDCGAGDAIR